jgi:RHS repeat-associated protein
MGARVYAPDLGVWTSVDPDGSSAPERFVTSAFAEANTYGYADGDSINRTDPSGHGIFHRIARALFGPPRHRSGSEGGPGWLNLTSGGDTFGQYVVRGAPGDDRLGVVIHGGRDGSIFLRNPRSTSEVSVEQVAYEIATSRKFKRQSIMLFACNAGKGGPDSLAQKLANLLNVSVWAAADLVWARDDGRTRLGNEGYDEPRSRTSQSNSSEVRNETGWREFKPQRR